MTKFKMGKLFNMNFLLVAIGGFILIRFGSKLFSGMGFMGSFSEEQKQLIEQAKKQADGVSWDRSKVTLTEAQLKQRADTLYQSFFGSPLMSLGTDEDLMWQALEGLNTEDLKAVYHYFGVRDAKLFGFNMFTGDLFGWFQDELSGESLKKVRKKFEPTGLWS